MGESIIRVNPAHVRLWYDLEINVYYVRQEKSLDLSVTESSSPIRTKDIKQTKCYPTGIVRRSQQGIHQFPLTNQYMSLEITSQSGSHAHECFNRHLNRQTFDQLSKATVDLCGHEDSAPTMWKSSFITILSTFKLSAIEKRITEARAVTEIGSTKPHLVNDPGCTTESGNWVLRSKAQAGM